MRLKSKSFKIALILTLSYFALGNLFGYLMADSSFHNNMLFFGFFPYSFIWFASEMEGWDYYSAIFELVTFIVSFFIFYPIGLLFLKKK